MKTAPALTGAAALYCALALCPFTYASPADLVRAREAAAAGSETIALELALEGFKADPADRELFLYAVELLPEKPSRYAPQLAEQANALIVRKGEDSAGYLGLCKAQRSSARTEEALSNCKKALELDPTFYPVYRELGLTWAAAGNTRKAEETLALGVEISSSSYKAFYNLARQQETLGGNSRAAASYSKGLALAGRYPGPDARRYKALLKAGLRRTANKAEKKARAKPAAPAAPTAPARKEQAAACLAKFKELVSQGDTAAAAAQSEACLKLSPSDPGLAAGRAPLLVRLGKYEDGVKEYTRAAELYGPRKDMAAFCRVKAAETWIKLEKPAKAIEQYNLALAANPGDINALKGLASALEARGDVNSAITVYEKIIKLSPSDNKIRARRDELNASRLTNDEMLAELLLRQAIDARKTALLPEDILLFKAIKTAEISGAVDMLKAKARSSRGLVTEKKTATGTRLLLTGAGYKAYNFYATREAVKFFEKQGVGLREMFKLRSLTGAPLFNAAGRLTYEGEDAWRKSVAGEKNWLLSYEPVPQSPTALKAEKDVQEFTGHGYEEISEPEYLWLMRYTDCPEDVLLATPLNMKTTTDGARMRYFMCFQERDPCMNMVNKTLPAAIGSYRNGNTDISDSKTSTSFFGSGGLQKKKVCVGGKVWTGGI